MLDAGGRVKAFQKQDGASLLRFEIAYGKAFAALALGRSSRMVLQKANEKPVFMQSLAELSDGPMFLEGGGQLIRDASGEVVGAVGVTGDVNEIDDLCAIDGIHAAGFRADDDFEPKAAQAAQHQEGAAAARPPQGLAPIPLRKICSIPERAEARALRRPERQQAWRGVASHPPYPGTKRRHRGGRSGGSELPSR